MPGPVAPGPVDASVEEDGPGASTSPGAPQAVEALADDAGPRPLAATTGAAGATPLPEVAVPGAGPTAPEVAAASVPESASVPQHVPAQGDLERAGAILHQVKLSLSPSLREAVIHLRPPELGRIAIRLVLDEGRASAVIRAETVEALDALGRHLPELRASLAQQGFTADDFDLALGFDGSGHGTGTSGRDEPTPGGDAWGGEAGSDTHALNAVDPSALARTLADAAGVDLYA